MISPALFEGLLALSVSQINHLEELSGAVPELFAIPDFDVKRICQSLRTISRKQLEEADAPEIEARVPQASTIARVTSRPPKKGPAPKSDLHEKALEVAKSDPTQSPPPPGWAVKECDCGTKFTVPRGGRLPTTCWECLSQAGRNLRTKNIRAFLQANP